MNKNKETKFKVKGPEAIEDGLMDMGRAIEAGGPWTHPEMERIPEWRGADIRITSDFERNYQEAGYFDHDLTVRTRHAGPVTWFVFQMRDLFDGWLDYGNKYGFYELLAQGALEHRASLMIEDRIWDMGGGGRWKVEGGWGFGEGNQFRKGLENGWQEAGS